jgi:hypothetical protein
MVRERGMEYTDAHAYWQHPEFSGQPWSATDWKIRNTPEVSVLQSEELARLAVGRVAGKPYSVSEFDHPAPSDYACEMMPTYATFAALQDWDAIYTFAVDYTSAPDRITGYFDQIGHPAKWCLYPSAALIFRQGLIAPAGAQAVLELPQPQWGPYEFAMAAWRAVAPESGADGRSRRVATSDQPLPAGQKARITQSGTSTPPQVKLQKTDAGNVYIAAAPAAATFVGYIGAATLSAGDVQLTTEAFGNNFAAVTVVATDGQPLASSRRILVTVCGRAENQGMVWNADRTSVGTRWGRGPTIAQYVPARVRLPVSGAPKVYALDSTGKRLKQVDAELVGGRLTVASRPTDATILYEISAD